MKVLGVEVPPAQVEKEPVLDVPAIDMTDDAAPEPVVNATRPTLSSKAESSQPKIRRSPAKRSVRSKAVAKRPSPRAAKVDAPRRTRNGSVGRETFEAVEALLKQGKNKTGAFKLVAADTGRNVGSVQAAYYRGAHASGAEKPRTPRPIAAPATTSRGRQKAARRASRRSSVRQGNGNGNVDQIVSQLTANVAALTEAVKAQDAEIQSLKGRMASVR